MPRTPSTHTLTYGLGAQVVTFVPADAELVAEGQPSDVGLALSLWRGTQGNDDTPLATAVPTLDTVATTITAAAGDAQTDRRKLELTSAVGVQVGHVYLLAGARREVVRIESLDGLLAKVDADLLYDYAVGAALLGIELSATIPATFCDEQSNINVWSARAVLGGGAVLRSAADTAAPPYRVRWSFAIGGVARERWSALDLRRQPAASRITIEDLRRRHPDVHWQEPASQRGQGFRPQIDEAIRLVGMDLRALKRDPSSFRDPELYDELCLRRLALVLAEAGLGRPSQVDLMTWIGHHERKYFAFLRTVGGPDSPAWVDAGGGGGTTPGAGGRLAFEV
jgi:hypothetical protein